MTGGVSMTGAVSMKRPTLALLATSLPLVLVPRPAFGADEPCPASTPLSIISSRPPAERPAWEARHSQIEHATMDFPKQGLKGSLTIYEAVPDKYLGVTELPAIGKISTGSNGEVAWENYRSARSPHQAG